MTEFTGLVDDNLKLLEEHGKAHDAFAAYAENILQPLIRETSPALMTSLSLGAPEYIDPNFLNEDSNDISAPSVKFGIYVGIAGSVEKLTLLTGNFYASGRNGFFDAISLRKPSGEIVYELTKIDNPEKITRRHAQFLASRHLNFLKTPELAS